MDKTRKDKILSFYEKHKHPIDELAEYVGVPPLWLVSVFEKESGLDYTRVNSIGATGLNQLMPSTAKGLGTDLNRYKTDINYQFAEMKKFFKPIRRKVRRAGDLYMFNFLPASVSQNVDFDLTLGEKGNYDRIWNLSKDSIYVQNKGLDSEKVGKITRRGVTDDFEERYDEFVALPEEKKIIRDVEVKAVVTLERNKKMIIVGIVLVVVSTAIGIGIYIVVNSKNKGSA